MIRYPFWNFYEVTAIAVQGFFRWEFQKGLWVCEWFRMFVGEVLCDLGQILHRFGLGHFGGARKSIMKILKIKKSWNYKKWKSTISGSPSGAVDSRVPNRLERSRCRVREIHGWERLWKTSTNGAVEKLMTSLLRKCVCEDIQIMTSPPSLETSRKIFKNDFSYGLSREAISRTDFLERYFYLQDFSKGFLEESYVVAGRQACWIQ